jgi:hypothetical protein
VNEGMLVRGLGDGEVAREKRGDKKMEDKKMEDKKIED